MKRIRFIYTKDKLKLRLDEQIWVSQADYIFFSGDLIPLELLAGRKSSTKVKKLVYSDEIAFALEENVDIVVLFESKSDMKDIVLKLDDTWINKKYIESLKMPVEGKYEELKFKKHQRFSFNNKSKTVNHTPELQSFIVSESLKPMIGSFWGN